jgi:predicted transcriptional regulator
MSIITVRIDDDLKKKMESFKHLNWSAIIRQAIIKTIQNEQENNRAKAILLNEKVRKSISKKVFSP